MRALVDSPPRHAWMFFRYAGLYLKSPQPRTSLPLVSIDAWRIPLDDLPFKTRDHATSLPDTIDIDFELNIFPTLDILLCKYHTAVALNFFL